MRWLLFLPVLLATPVHAAPPAYPGCNPDILSFTEWSAEPIDETYFQVTTTIVSKAEKPIRMIDASGGYIDALGMEIGTFGITRDLALPVGGSHTETKRWGPHTFERLLKLRPEEVETFTCTYAVLYEDGTKEVFK